ncbi:MAG: bifunctional phosphoribosyl-AMP cyclohydrolase/phosphoribosyl-ATP diphosphatase HisIE [Chitinophagaceae bacterium]|jgi:phosphoribosyl-ATP pyrophosphohydrolase/phosphoribosyl-AMP cyclohydrolase|nr:bifunctional phosphoribosyl-AMP cyclohydrolase/phosphoribosyl-ATP diphosphatase HisIE [Chitinophagaceae bacterium]
MQLNYSKYADGLVPAIVQDAQTGKVLMLGFMNEEALMHTQQSGLVTFYSRSKQRLWTKGEESGHYLRLQSITADCDADTLLLKAVPVGPVCHTGADTCFNEVNEADFLQKLIQTIDQRYEDRREGSYTSALFDKGINAMAQKVGEEAVEVVIEAKDNDREKFLGEAADLLFHYLVLLRGKGFSLGDVIGVLKSRHK